MCLTNLKKWDKVMSDQDGNQKVKVLLKLK